MTRPSAPWRTIASVAATGLALSAACSGTTDLFDAGIPPNGGRPDAADNGDASVGRSPDLGKNCPMGCNLTLCASTSSSSCENGICAWDGRTGIEAYCSQSSANVPCPAGWNCLLADDGQGKFCFARPAVCGNGVLERGEVCDPGPSVGTPASGCAPGCQATISGGSASYKWDGFLVEFSGTSADGNARAAANLALGFVDIAFYQPSAASLSLRLELADLAGPVPKTVTGRVAFDDLFDSWCFFNPGPSIFGKVIQVTTWDGGYHLVGSFDGTLTYSRCCSFCVDPSVTSHVISESHFDVFFEDAVTP